jgi:hypothetical protein
MKVNITVKETEYTTKGICTLDFNKTYAWSDDEIEKAMSEKEWSNKEGMLKTRTITKAFKDGLMLAGSEVVYSITK